MYNLPEYYGNKLGEAWKRLTEDEKILIFALCFCYLLRKSIVYVMKLKLLRWQSN